MQMLHAKFGILMKEDRKTVSEMCKIPNISKLLFIIHYFAPVFGVFFTPGKSRGLSFGREMPDQTQ